MTQLQYPNRPTVSGEIQKNFEAITAVVNGDLRDDNIAEQAAINGSKLADGSIPAGKLALGVAPPGVNNGDILVWNSVTGQWVPQAQAAVVAGNADKLDGIDSLGFMQRKVAGSDQILWMTTPAFTAAANSVQTVNHSLGRTPAIILVWPLFNSQVDGSGAASTSTQFFIRWTAATTGATAQVLLIG